AQRRARPPSSAKSAVEYCPNTAAKYQRSVIPESMRQMRTKKTEVRFHDMAACGRRNESEKSNTIPVHQRITIRMREPLSRASALPVDRLTLQATTSGSTHSAQATHKLSA